MLWPNFPGFFCAYEEKLIVLKAFESTWKLHCKY